jgi:hypothetical protein
VYFLLTLLAALVCVGAEAHGIGGKDAEFVALNTGAQLLPFAYLGAKHMVTGYDHLLFILGVIFFLYRMAHVALYVTLFSIGHSITLLAGVLGGFMSTRIVDAVIGLSVVYKAFDNLGGFRLSAACSRVRHWQCLALDCAWLRPRHELQALSPSPDGLAANTLPSTLALSWAS